MKLIVCGDLLFSSRHLASRMDQRITEDLREADAVFGNAEFCTPEVDTAPAIGRGYVTAVTPDTLKEFAELHIQLVNFANNHTGDFGVQGILDTLHAAEKEHLTALGIGRNLSEARKTHFADTPSGRIAVVSAGSTRSEVFAASDPGSGIAGRPGSNPLRWHRAYVLPEKEFDELRRIDELLGTANSRREGERIETFPSQEDDRFKFGSLFEGNLQIERGDHAYVRTWADPKDEKALLRRIDDAAKRSDFVLATLHTHEGRNENWYDDRPAAFVEEFARKAIDAGASAFVGHGAHFLKGVEIYKGKPIFYNIGSLIMEFEAGESKMPWEMFEAYGYGPDALPSDLHRNRIKDQKGRFIGFGSERRFSQNVYIRFDIGADHTFSYQLVPLDLDMTRDNPLKRGWPEIATAEEGKRITERLQAISKAYGTQFHYNEKSGTISVL